MNVDSNKKKDYCSDMSQTKVIGYVRVSTTMQADEGASLAAQEAKLRAYCTALSLELVGLEVDAGFSASSLNRPALQRALEALRTRKADALLVCKLDRLTRNLSDLGTLVTKHFGKRASLISVEESINTTSASGKLVLNLLTSVSSWEREAIGERTAAVKTHLKAQGSYLGGGVPFGYRREGEKIVADDDEQAVVAAARALKAAGMSMRSIAATLTARGLRARNGHLGAGNVQRILSSSGINTITRTYLPS